MDLAIVRRECSLTGGGAERYCAAVARQLKTLGHRVTVVGEKMDPALASEVSFLPVKVNHAASWTKNRSFAENAGRAVQSAKFDVVLGLSRTYHVDVHRVTDRLQAHWMGIRYPGPLLRRLQRLNPRHCTVLRLEREIVRSTEVRRIVTESRLDARLVQRYYAVPEEKIRTVYNGVDTTLFHPGVRQHAGEVREQFGIGLDDPLLVFASMDFAGKGLRTVLAAMAKCKAPTKLLVLGRGPASRFGRVANDLGLADRVIFAGYQRGIERFYGAGDLFVLPTAYEPFGLVHLEALACGLPVLTTATAGGAEVVEHGANGYILSHAQAADELAECLWQYFSLTTDQREAMRARAWEKARGMTIERHAQNLVAVLEEAWREKFRV